MIGIYKITNLFTGESYSGQSTNLERRFREHRNSSEDSYIDNAIFEIGAENFSFEVLEFCTEDRLDSLEDYYIDLYKSNYEGFGYNIVRGGQHNIGESNPRAKLTEIDVYNIREAYKNHENKSSVYDKYKHKISEYYFSNVWEGHSWKNIHYDVYSEENKRYYMKETSIGEKSASAVFTDEEVLELRKRYVNESAKQIYESVKDRCKFQTLQMILWGQYYSNIDIYDKRNKVWIKK